MKNMIMRFVKDEQGQDLIEYTLADGFRRPRFGCHFHQRRHQHQRDLELGKHPAGQRRNSRELGFTGPSVPARQPPFRHRVPGDGFKSGPDCKGRP